MGRMAFGAIQALLLGGALKRLIRRVEKKKYDRGFVSDSVFVVGSLILLILTIEPSTFRDLRDYLGKLVGSSKESEREEG